MSDIKEIRTSLETSLEGSDDAEITEEIIADDDEDEIDEEMYSSDEVCLILSLSL